MTNLHTYRLVALAFLLFFTFYLNAQTPVSEIKETGIQLRISAGMSNYSLYIPECGYGISDWKDILDENFCASVIWVGGPDSIGCATTGTPLTDKVVLIREGGCPVATKVEHAQAGGAKAVLIVQHSGTPLPPVSKFELGGNTQLPPVQVPAFYLKQSDVQTIQPALQSGENVTACFTRPAAFLNSVTYPGDIQQYCYSTIDTFAFGVRLSNLSGATLENVLIRGVLLFNGVEELQSTVTIPQVTASVSDSLYWLSGPFPFLQLPAGVHQATYTVQGTLNGIPYLDVRNVQFDVNRPVFAKELTGAHVAYRPDSIPDLGWGVANLFYITGTSGWYFIAPEATVSVFPGTENAGSPCDIQVFLFAVNEDVMPDLSNFSTQDFLSDNLTLLGTGNKTVYPTQDQTTFTVEILSLETAEQNLQLPANKYYVLAVFLEGESRYCYIGFDESYRAPSVSTMVYTDHWETKGMYGAPNAMIRLKLEQIDGFCTSGTNEPTHIDFKIFPNPCRDQLTLRVGIDETTEANIFVADMTGRIFLTDSRRLFNDEQLTFPTSKLPDGAYSIRITTKEGSLTKKFVVRKE